MGPDVFFLILYILAGPHQGDKLQYQDQFKNKTECLEAREFVKAKLFKDNPGLTERTFDNNFILVCAREGSQRDI